VLVVWKLDRLWRSLKHLLEIIEDRLWCMNRGNANEINTLRFLH
jgi:hypothetical protein